MSSFSLRSLDPETERIVAEEPIDGDQQVAYATWESICKHVKLNGGCFELMKDGARLFYVNQPPPAARFSVAPDGTTEDLSEVSTKER